MIDFHSHIIPSVDDGAKNAEEAFKLLDEAKKVGFNSIILTPHYMENYYQIDKNTNIEVVKLLYKGLSYESKDLRLYLANEIYLTSNILDLLKANKIASINDSRYVLIECPINSKPMNLHNIIEMLLKENFIPIIAHPERYNLIQKEPEIINELANMGVLFQSNYGSILGQYGKKAQIIVKILLRSNLVHFLGSDVHKANTIYPLVPKATAEIKKIISNDMFETITDTNPSLVLNDSIVIPEEPIKIKLTFREKFILNRK